VGAPDADILAAAIEILRKRIAAGTATLLVKVKAHRGEPANEGANILSDVVPCLLTFFDKYCHLYILCLLHQLFLAADSWKLFSSPQRAHVTFFVKRDKLELAFWLVQRACCHTGASRWSGGQP
jgi:hypothetical protein